MVLPRWIGCFALLSAALVASLSGARAQLEEEAPPSGGAEAIQASLEIERTLLREDLERHERLAAERARAAARLVEAYTELDAALGKSEGQLASSLEEGRGKLAKAETARADLAASEGAVLDKIDERLRRIRLLEEKLAAFPPRTADAGGPLSGRWDVTLLPAGYAGIFALTQSGTIVTGTYQLEGGWTGSLQGTLVNRKVHLERIDSKQGRSGEYEGFLSGDGLRIRGSWRSYELAARDSASGQWSAVRRPSN